MALRQRRLNRPGFTLVEVLVVIAIFGILMALGAYVYTAALARSRDSQRLSDLQFIRNGLEQFYLDNRSYPIYTSKNPDLPEASWQLESGYKCQDPSKPGGYVAPKYVTKLPQDPSYRFVEPGGGCSAVAFGQYLYFGLPKTTSKTGYYLLARMERVQNVNYSSDIGTALNLAGYSDSLRQLSLCNKTDFGNRASACTQNYFVSGSKNN